VGQAPGLRLDPQLRTTIVKKTAADILREAEAKFMGQVASIKDERTKIGAKWLRLQAGISYSQNI
jgi:hypothetical protein